MQNEFFNMSFSDFVITSDSDFLLTIISDAHITYKNRQNCRSNSGFFFIALFLWTFYSDFTFFLENLSIWHVKIKSYYVFTRVPILTFCRTAIQTLTQRANSDEIARRH